MFSWRPLFVISTPHDLRAVACPVRRSPMSPAGSSHMSQRPRRRGGFTFVELASSVAVVMLLTAMVVPSIRRITNSQRAGRAARVLASDLERGFSLATRIRQPVVLTCRCDAHVFEVRLASTDSVIFARRFDEASGFGLDGLVASGSAIVTQAGVGSAPLTFTVSAGVSSRQVTLSTAGLAGVVRP